MLIIYAFYHRERKEWKIPTASTIVVRPTRWKICAFNDGFRTGNIEEHQILFPLPVGNP